MNVLVDNSKSKSEFTDTLEEWVAVFYAHLKVEHSEDAFKAKDVVNSMTYRWEQETYYVYLTGSAKAITTIFLLSTKLKWS